MRRSSLARRMEGRSFRVAGCLMREKGGSRHWMYVVVKKEGGVLERIYVVS